MSDGAWTLHWLEAEGSLAPWRDRIEAEVAAAAEAVGRAVPRPRVDLVIQAVPGGGIPGLGIGSHAFRRGRIDLTFDPGSADLPRSLAGDLLRRMVAHEAHHCLRHAGPGYGRTLGEALVSEGLADHFAGELFGPPPLPWNAPFTEAERGEVLARAEPLLRAPRYDHAAWFYADGRSLPRWAGYRLGYLLVGAHLAAHPMARPSGLAGAPGRDLLDDAWPRLRP
ncbi:DUF2268 domain-containing putative Zn-dependent protease [Paracraurococcus lichenis]|uniref:DUF2268 domain-containing putative Zn-dependent protease n=1 Tax=Paracraurococcus lichenis TaxID=3064888 RepID=A0ABT9E6C5_9PROT|nr:DUF2268 domain-containing putative Zn-dependent protease [Paracraurococcus sp. LOR1-02]MDO9711672.1 DUF2268 domain-containing putative Zn-dependent protease [Paracraurococcus sp. LOR1-02]